jgi:ATP-dependent metalloprotease
VQTFCLRSFSQNDGVIVIGATNFPELLDKALVRPGRFDKHVVVPMPDVQGRFDILELHMKNIPRAPGVDLRTIARATPGLSGGCGVMQSVRRSFNMHVCTVPNR